MKTSTWKTTALALGALNLAGLALAQPGASIRVDNASPFTATGDPVDPDSASGGRVNRIAASSSNPLLFYAASEYGGLFVSSDLGDRWAPAAGHRVATTWDVAIHPTNPDLVIATSHYDGQVTSTAGIRVRRPRDGIPVEDALPRDYRWTKPASATPPAGFDCDLIRKEEPHAFGVAFDPGSPNRVYAGTNCGLAISEDSGSTWRFVDPTPGDPASDVWDVIVHNGGIIDICGDDGHYRSTDAGARFTTAPAGGVPLPSGVCTLAASPDESYVLFATVGTRIFETDDGTNWRVRYPNPSLQGRIPFVKTNQRSGPTFDLWFGDIGLHRTTCTTPATPALGGPGRCSAVWSASFTRPAGAHDDAGDLAFATTPPTDACPVLFSSDGGVYVNTVTTSPGCHTPQWEQPSQTPRSLWLWDLDGADRIRSAAEDLYLGAQDNGPFGVQDAPASGPDWKSAQCCDVFDVEAGFASVVYSLCCSSIPPATRLYQAGRDLVGISPVPMPPGLLIGFQDMDTIQTTDIGTAVVTTAGAFFSTDLTNPAAWAPLGAGSVPASLCSIQDSRLGDDPTTPVVDPDEQVFVGKSNRCTYRLPGPLWIYAGRSDRWTQIPVPTDEAGVPLAGGFGVFAVNPRNARHIIASFLSAGDPQMMETRDGGANWGALPELDRLMTGDLVYRYQVRNGRFGFNQFGPYPQPSLLAFDPADPRNVVAGGIDSGVFLSQRGGVDSSWLELRDTSFPERAITRPKSAYFDSNALFGRWYVYVGTRGRGVVRVEYQPITLPGG